MFYRFSEVVKFRIAMIDEIKIILRPHRRLPEAADNFHFSTYRKRQRKKCLLSGRTQRSKIVDLSPRFYLFHCYRKYRFTSSRDNRNQRKNFTFFFYCLCVNINSRKSKFLSLPPWKLYLKFEKTQRSNESWRKFMKILRLNDWWKFACQDLFIIDRLSIVGIVFLLSDDSVSKQFCIGSLV